MKVSVSLPTNVKKTSIPLRRQFKTQGDLSGKAGSTDHMHVICGTDRFVISKTTKVARLVFKFCV
jgi:hypothetical protein